MITLYGMPQTRSFRVLWTLEELGASYRYQVVDLGKGEGRTAEFLALNPGGKLPVLTDGELVLCESAAICTYLADSHPEKNLIPARGSFDRARCNQWGYFVLSELEQPLWTMGKHKFALPKEYRIPEIQKTALFEFMRAVSVLEKGLWGRRFLVGEDFTLADLLAVHTLHWAQAFKVDHGSQLLDDYRERIKERVAWQKAQAIDAARKGEL